MNGHTRIMATLATSRCSTDFVRSLVGEGMEAVRINSAHVTPFDIENIISTVRAVDAGIKILMDTKGPEIRTAPLSGPDLVLHQGDHVSLLSSQEPSVGSCIHVCVENLHSFLAPGCRIVLDDGEIELEVIAIDGNCVKAEVVKSGTLGSRKTVNIPGVEIPPLPAVSMRDRQNIEAARKFGIDMIAHSFVRSVSDVQAVRECSGPGIQIYSKIECPQAVDNLDGILGASDGLLVARGDLGTCMPLEQVPSLQYAVAMSCRAAGKPFIVSTQILQSMCGSPSPTRAEVSDIALAVMEGADWLLLCGETALGRYPAQCVAMMRRTISSTEKSGLRCKIY